MIVYVPDTPHFGGVEDRILRNLFKAGPYRLLGTWPEVPRHVVAMAAPDGTFVLIPAIDVVADVGFGPVTPTEGLRVDGQLYMTDVYHGVLYFDDEPSSAGYYPMVKIRVGGAIRLEEMAE